MKIKVQCTLEVDIEVPDYWDDEDGKLEFMIEDNTCPGTGLVGTAIETAFEHGNETSICWACALKGKNKILSIEE